MVVVVVVVGQTLTQYYHNKSIYLLYASHWPTTRILIYIYHIYDRRKYLCVRIYEHKIIAKTVFECARDTSECVCVCVVRKFCTASPGYKRAQI